MENTTAVARWGAPQSRHGEQSPGQAAGDLLQDIPQEDKQRGVVSAGMSTCRQRTGVMMSDLNQKILPCLSTNHLWAASARVSSNPLNGTGKPAFHEQGHACVARFLCIRLLGPGMHYGVSPKQQRETETILHSFNGTV